MVDVGLDGGEVFEDVYASWHAGVFPIDYRRNSATSARNDAVLARRVLQSVYEVLRKRVIEIRPSARRRIAGISARYAEI